VERAPPPAAFEVVVVLEFAVEKARSQSAQSEAAPPAAKRRHTIAEPTPSEAEGELSWGKPQEEESVPGRDDREAAVKPIPARDQEKSGSDISSNPEKTALSKNLSIGQNDTIPLNSMKPLQI
jgi:hypothetical protein